MTLTEVDLTYRKAGRQTIWEAYTGTKDQPVFIVDGLLHDSITILYALDGAGKSLFTCELALALTGLPSALGRFDIESKPRRVAILTTDARGEREYANRIGPRVPTGYADIEISELRAVPDLPEWVAGLREDGFTDVVVDNLSGLFGGLDVNDPKDIIRAQTYLAPIVEAEMALFVLAHKPAAGGHKPAGSHKVRAWARHNLNMSDSGQTITADGNDSAKRTFKLTHGGDPYRVLDVRETTKVVEMNSTGTTEDVAAAAAGHGTGAALLGGRATAYFETVKEAATALHDAGYGDGADVRTLQKWIGEDALITSEGITLSEHAKRARWKSVRVVAITESEVSE